jgi:equilibrative nucleoside transporter 1/2/3
MDEESGAPKSYLSTKIIFILFGVASLLGWNALLTELDFFQFFLEKMNPYVSFSFLNYILNIGFLCLLMIKKDLFSLKFQLIGGIIGSMIFLIIIPMFTLILEKNSSTNIFVTGMFVFLMGFINALCSGGFFNLVSNFPLEMIVSLSTGQGFSGIAMNILQYIVLVSITSDNMDNDEDEKERIYKIRGWIFFGISCFILLISLILLLIYYNTEYFQYYLNKARNTNRGEEAATQLIEGETTPDEQKDLFEPTPITKELSFKEIFLKIWDLNFLMAYIYIVTFALFPNASISQDLFGLKEDYNDYNVNTIILIYNVFDTIGRYTVAKVKPTKKLNLIITLGRSILLFTLILNYYCQKSLDLDINLTSILLILNEAFLAATNGISTTLCFGIAPNQVENEYKGQAGTSLSFFLIVGIFLGACIAFGTDAIMNSFPEKN